MGCFDSVLQHFQDREVLSAKQLHQQFSLPVDVSDDDLERALEIFATEYNLPAGKLRADDSLDLFVRPPRIRNPITWFFTQSAYEDRLSELNYHIKKARKRAHVAELSASPKTARDYVLACLGRDFPDA